MVQITATFLVVKFGAIYKLSVDPTQSIDRISSILQLFLSSEQLCSVRDKILLKYKGVTLSPLNKLSWYLYAPGQIIEVYYPDTLPVFTDVDTSIIALRSSQALTDEGIEAVMKIQDELKNEPLCLVRFFKVLISFIQYDPDLIFDIQNIRDDDGLTLPEKLNFLYNKYRYSSKNESKDVLEHLVFFITLILYQDPLISPDHVIKLPKSVYEKYLSMMLDIMRRYMDSNPNLVTLAAYSINYFLNNRENRYYVLDSPTFRNLEEILYQSFDKTLLLPLILAFYNYLYLDTTAIFSNHVVQLFSTISNKIMDFLKEADIISIYLNLIGLVYKDQSEASRCLNLLPKFLSQLYTLYYNPSNEIFTLIYKSLMTITREVLSILSRNKNLVSTILSGITLSGLSEDQYLFIMGTLANMASSKDFIPILMSILPNVLALRTVIFSSYKSNTNLVMNYICFLNNMIYHDRSVLSQMKTIQILSTLHLFISNTFTPLYLAKAIFNLYLLAAQDSEYLQELSTYYTNDCSLLLNNINQSHNYVDMDQYYYKKLGDMIKYFKSPELLLTPNDYAYDPQTIEEYQIADYYKQLPFPNDYINEKVEDYQEKLYFVSFMLEGEKKGKYQMYVPVDIKVSALQYLWPTYILRSVSYDNELMDPESYISKYIHENNKRVLVQLDPKTNVIVNAQIDSTKTESNINTSYQGTESLNRDFAAAAYQNAKNIVDKFKQDNERETNDLPKAKTRVIRIGGELVEAPADFETEEEKQIRELKEAKMKSEQKHDWDRIQTNGPIKTLDEIHYEPEVKPVAILREQPAAPIVVEPTITIIEHKEEDEFTKDLAPLSSIHDIPEVRPSLINQNLDTEPILDVTDDIDIDLDDIDINPSDFDTVQNEPLFNVLQPQTESYIDTIKTQDPYTVMAYIQLHQTPIYDCLSILTAIVENCIDRGSENSHLNVYSDVILPIITYTYEKLTQIGFNFEFYTSLLKAIWDLSPADNVLFSLVTESSVEMVMNILFTIQENKNTQSIDERLDSYFIPACFLLYNLTPQNDGQTLTLFDKHRLRDYLMFIYKDKEFFTCSPKFETDYRDAIDSLVTITTDLIDLQRQVRKTVIYDWSFVIKNLLKASLNSISEEYITQLSDTLTKLS